MAAPGLLTDRAELEALFDELAAELDRVGLDAEIVMVGGSWLLWHTQRAATRDVDSCDIVYRRPGLVLRAPSADVIFVMKLYRADPQDREDMIGLWPLCTFATPAHAAQAFQDSYPHAPDDEHLEQFVRDIARDAR